MENNKEDLEKLFLNVLSEEELDSVKGGEEAGFTSKNPHNGCWSFKVGIPFSGGGSVGVTCTPATPSPGTPQYQPGYPGVPYTS